MNAPSPWLTRWQHLLVPGMTALDLACGSGRHLRWLAAQGLRVTGVDRDAEALAPLRALGQSVQIIEADIEAGPWPLAERRFDLVLVANYLWRLLLPAITAAVAPGGLLIYETFGLGNEAFGRPRSPDFLLRPGELLVACKGLRVLAYEEGVVPGADAGERRAIQRIAARRPADAVNAEEAPVRLQ